MTISCNVVITFNRPGIDSIEINMQWFCPKFIQMEVNHWHPELEIWMRDIVEVRCLLLYQLSEVGDIFSRS